MGSCAAPSAKGDDKFITTDYLQQCPPIHHDGLEIEHSVISGRVNPVSDRTPVGRLLMKFILFPIYIPC
ncbi:hypothetical protein DG98_005051 [Salmonella enterica subsp. enterica serovar Mbandaka]|nr:hypothetical protein [Salmonella enterica subsp. enterica serovar Mbandaka]EEA2533428.1 hypothetical protein [Salmonella enterica subsp. enterica serovar Schwarzengrund]